MIELCEIPGPALGERLAQVAALRIEIFREFPYLYDGDLDYERRYLATYQRCPDALFVLAYDGSELVGVSTAIPLRAETEEVRQPFEAAGLPVDSVVYFGESVLRTSHRGRGLGHRFFDAREAHARGFSTTRQTAFCAVDRPQDHALRPTGHRSLDPFWQGRGYRRRPDLQAEMDWKDIDQPGPSRKRLIFWLKDWPALG